MHRRISQTLSLGRLAGLTALALPGLALAGDSSVPRADAETQADLVLDKVPYQRTERRANNDSMSAVSQLRRIFNMTAVRGTSVPGSGYFL